MKRWNWAAVAVGTAVFLAGCGGASDGADTAPKATAKAFKVFGDSIADSGTFGYKFTIQGKDADGNAFKIFPEVVAANLGVSSLCAFFNFNGTTFVPNTTCTNYAVAGGRVNNLSNSGAPTNAIPFSIPFQMDAAAAGLTATDVVMVDGGGNDLADLTGAYLGISQSPSGLSNYLALLGTALPQATIGAILGATPNQTTLGIAAGAYAQAVGKQLAAAVKTKILAKGVTKVIVVNSADITVTPRFRAVLGGIAASGPTGPATSEAVKGAVLAWTKAFNDALAADLAGTSVQLFDLNAEGAKIVANPAQFSFTNITTPACPKVTGGLDSITGQASLSAAVTVAACNAAAMSTGIPTGETASDWWQHYAYSDNFHPTPALHKLIAQAINLQLARAGWL